MSTKKSVRDYPSKQYFLPELPFRPMRHGAANNALAHVPAKKSRYQVDKIAKTLTYANGKLTVKIDGIDKPIPDSALRLLDFITLEHTRKNSNGNSTAVEFSFDDYANYRGVTDKQARMRLRQQMQDDIDKLYRLSFEWNDPDNHDSIKTRLIYHTEVFKSKQRVKVSLIPEFARYTNGRYLMPFDTRLGKLDGRNPNAYKIGRKLIEHYRNLSNHADGTHKKADTYDRLSVQSLLDAAPDIPTFEEVRDKYSRHYRQKIITPLEKCMDELVEAGIVKEWTWWKAANMPLTDEELEQADWETLQNCMVHFRLYEPPTTH